MKVIGESLLDTLQKQLGEHKLNDKETEIGNFIIGCINDDGYLTRDTQAIADDLVFSKNLICTVEEIKKILEIVQTFDPPGIGALNLKECLIIQLNRKQKTEHIERAIVILKRKFLSL